VGRHAQCNSAMRRGAASQSLHEVAEAVEFLVAELQGRV
jgi:hypothetical protein